MQIASGEPQPGPDDMAALHRKGVAEYLVFSLGREEYAIDIQRVQELRGYEAVTCIAGTPDFIKGVINLRGTVVPIIDMRIKLNIAPPTYGALTVLVILNVATGLVGAVVDGVSDVVMLTRDQIRPMPSMDAVIDADCFHGLGMLDGRMILLLDIDKVIPPLEAAQLNTAHPKVESMAVS
ncbi:MAG TPA: chemotaxis protein CheW [Noviherbaspirillum sp.]|uniref:chemotaxis protein CheW n=1 Tax=Noviherbaspirillum sp. TaxID=1926288 RepID=UPI002B45E572|nr:chemotaxis protein CheW [Noviherbaspirillum sp.]HJV84134.1 chemotaxis protein CheW [Noviherbaspirillum sp.]